MWLLFVLLLAGRLVAQTAPSGPLRPADVAFDAAGNLYFTDAGRHQVFKASLAGVLTVIAGTGVQGFGGDGGSATSARLDEPHGLAVAADGTVYIADTGNARVRSVSDGVITTVAGQGSPGYSGDGGPAVSARLNRPAGLALSSDGTLYIADSANQRVRALRSGTLSTVAGDGVEGFAGDGGPAVQARLSDPEEVAVASDGRLFISDTHNARLRVVFTDGMIQTFAGSGVEGFDGEGGKAVLAHLSRPSGVAVSGWGDVYFADRGNQRLREVQADGTVRTVAGTGVQGAPAEGAAVDRASLDAPAGVAVSPLGVVWFADRGNATVRAIAGGSQLFRPAALVARASSVQATVSVGSAQTALAVKVSGQAGVAQGTVLLRLDGVASSQNTLAAGEATLSFQTTAGTTPAYTVEYSGDVLNPGVTVAVSPTGAVATVLTATANAAAMHFGDNVPALTGTLAGLPAQDAARVQVSFVTAATPLSGVGVYPITAQLQGGAAASYVLQLSPASGKLTIAPAQSTTALLTPAPIGYEGLPLTLSATVAAPAKGTPTGMVTFLENGVALITAKLVNGSATGVLASPAVGQHGVVARYSGDANFTGSDSAAQTIAVNVLPDFTVTQVSASPPTMTPGTAATFNFVVGASPAPFTGAVAMATAGLPSGWTAHFAPPSVIPGMSAPTVVLTVTASGTAQLHWPVSSGLVVAALLILPWLRPRRGRFLSPAIGLWVLTVAAFALSGCGDRVASTADLVAPHPASFSVTGTATNLAGQVVTHTVVVAYLQP